jgi:hypothetical protein
VRFLSETVAGSKIGGPSEQLLTALAAGGLFEVQTAEYRCFTDQVLRIIKAWPPEYISCSHPFVSCLIIGPAAIHARVLKHDKLDQASDSRGQSEIDMEVLKLALSHLAKAWKFGALIVGKLASAVYSSVICLLTSGQNRPCRLGKQEHVELTLVLLPPAVLEGSHLL